MSRSLKSAIRVSLIYCVFAGLWIIFSDKALEFLVRDVTLLTQAQTIKGWFFVAVTTALLFVVVSKAFHTIESLNQMDGLTGLLRYFAFKHDLDAKIEHRQEEQAVVVMYLDISQFRHLNESLGFETADSILVSFSKRLKNMYSADVGIGRLGPDQFAISLVTLNETNQIEDGINQLRHIFDTSARSRQIDMSCVIGVAIHPSDGQNASALMSAATSALNKAKAEKSMVQFFNKELSQQETQRQQLLQELRTALQEQSLSVVYQPQFDLKTEVITGVEVLIRWQHPTKGFIPPDVFVELAEENNLCDQISQFVLNRAEKELKAFDLLGDAIPRVSINISALEFNSSSLMQKLIEQIEKVPDLAKYLQVEITETAALVDLKKSVNIIKQLNEKGIRFSVDDFGTGYTSLVILRDLPVDEVKIDRSFIASIEQDKKSRAIVEAIITMTKGFDVSVVAEGVESQEQQVLLAQMGCTEAQGYLLAMPMDIKTLSYHITHTSTA